jgi:hypothetical protein
MVKNPLVPLPKAKRVYTRGYSNTRSGKPIDWVFVEEKFRAGIMTMKELAMRAGCSEEAIRKHARVRSWTRDLSTRIEQKRQEKLERMALDLEAKEMGRRPISDESIVEANAIQGAEIVMKHRKELDKIKKTIVALTQELNTLSNKELRDALELLKEGKVKKGVVYESTLNKAFEAAMALPGRSATARQLTVAIGSLIDKEREAFGIDMKNQNQKSLPEWLETLS